MEHFTNLHVILAQGPCLSSLYHSNFGICAAEASTQEQALKMTAQGKRNGLSNSPLSYLRNHTPEPVKTPTVGHQGGGKFVWTVWAERNCCSLSPVCPARNWHSSRCQQGCSLPTPNGSLEMFQNWQILDKNTHQPKHSGFQKNTYHELPRILT